MSEQDGPDGQTHQDHGQGVDERAGSVGSGAMESTPALDSPIPHHHEPSSLIEALEDEPTEVAPISLSQRLRQPRTIPSSAETSSVSATIGAATPSRARTSCGSWRETTAFCG